MLADMAVFDSQGVVRDLKRKERNVVSAEQKLVKVLHVKRHLCGTRGGGLIGPGMDDVSCMAGYQVAQRLRWGGVPLLRAIVGESMCNTVTY